MDTPSDPSLLGSRIFTPPPSLFGVHAGSNKVVSCAQKAYLLCIAYHRAKQGKVMKG